MHRFRSALVLMIAATTGSGCDVGRRDRSSPLLADELEAQRHPHPRDSRELSIAGVGPAVPAAMASDVAAATTPAARSSERDTRAARLRSVPRGTSELTSKEHRHATSGRLARVKNADLCITRGELAESAAPQTGIRIEVPTFRAVARATGGDAAAIRFVVEGTTDELRALASGQLRRQLGLKLRAENGCNLVYVMWRLDPRPKLEVSVKRNRGARTSTECGADGYVKVRPQRTLGTLPTLIDGHEHALRAEIRGDELMAWIDDEVAWEGRLPAVAGELAGPIGVRSDNLAFELRALEGDVAAEGDREVDAVCMEQAKASD